MFELIGGILIMIIGLAAGFIFAYGAKKTGLVSLPLAGIIVSFLVMIYGIWLVGDSQKEPIDYVPIVVQVGGVEYTGKWYPEEQDSFTAYDADWEYCIQGKMYKVGYGTAG